MRSVKWFLGCVWLLQVDTRQHASFSLGYIQQHAFFPLTLCKYMIYNIFSIPSLYMNFNNYYTLFLWSVHVTMRPGPGREEERRKKKYQKRPPWVGRREKNVKVIANKPASPSCLLSASLIMSGRQWHWTIAVFCSASLPCLTVSWCPPRPWQTQFCLHSSIWNICRIVKAHMMQWM